MRHGAIVFLSLTVLVGVCAAATAAGDLAETLPPDAIAVLRVTGLHEQWKAFRNSDAFTRLEGGPIPDIGDGIRKARENISQFEIDTALDIEQCLSSIFGTDMLLAIFADQTAAFVARTDDLQSLHLGIDTILAIEREEGKLVSMASEFYRDVEIHSSRLNKPNKPGAPMTDRCHAVVGDLLIVSEELSVVRRVLDVVKSNQPSVAASPEYREAAKLMSSNALVRAYFDMDRISEMLDLETLLDGNIRNPFIKVLAVRMKRILPATRYVVGGLTASDGLMRLRCNIIYDEQKLAPSLRTLFSFDQAELDIMNLAPRSAAFALAHRVNKLALWHYLLASIAESSPQLAADIALQVEQIGSMFGAMEFESELLPQIGEQTALVLTPGSGQNPPALSIVIELNDTQSIPLALKTMAGSFAKVAQVEAEKKGVEPAALLRRANYAGTDLFTLVLNDEKLAGKVNPTLFVYDRFMVVSTSPYAAQAMLDARKNLPAGKLAASRATGTLVSRGRVNPSAVRGMIRRHRDFLIGEALKDGKTRAKAAGDIAALLFLSGFLESVDFEVSHSPGRIERIVEIRFDGQSDLPASKTLE